MLLDALISLIYFEDCACILTGTGTATTSGRTPAARTSSLPAGATATTSASLPQKVSNIEKLSFILLRGGGGGQRTKLKLVVDT